MKAKSKLNLAGSASNKKYIKKKQQMFEDLMPDTEEKQINN
jgi:hypothetical protein